MGFALLIVGGVILENYRGHYSWKKYRREWEAKGEQLDLMALVPKSVPADQNFAATPFFLPYLDYTIDPNNREQRQRWKDRQAWERNRALASRPGSLKGGRNSPETGRWQLSAFTDLKEWQQFFHGNTNFPFAAIPQDPATDVLTALRRYDPLLEELRAASERPHSVFPVHYEEHFHALLPHLGSLKSISETVQLRAIAHLEAGSSAEALHDVQFGLRLADTLKQERFLISALTRIAMVNAALQPIWEGLARQRWNEPQIQALQTSLAQMNVLEDYRPTMRLERAVIIYFVDQLRTGTYRDLTEDDDETDLSMTRYLPGGIFRQNQRTIARVYQERALPVINAEEHRVYVDGAEQAERINGAERLHAYNLFVKMLFPGASGAAARFARGQAELDLAITACALERHRLATGRYPDTLHTLTLKFMEKLRPDVVTGEPLKYHLTNSNKFVLYSVGWNQRDDGGTPGLTQNKRSFDPKKGDWVWRYSD